MGTYYDTGTQWIRLRNGVADGGSTPPPNNDIYVGMLNSPVGEAQWVITEAEWGGVKSGIARTFSPGLPSTPPTDMTRSYGKRASWHSVKADWDEMASGVHDSTLISFLNAVPADHELMFTFAHEPENDGVSPANGSNPAYNAWVAEYAPKWRAACEHFYDVVKATRPQTLVGPVLMGFTFDSSSHRDPNDWRISGSKCDFYGLDPYNPYLFPMVGAPNNWVNQPSSQVTAFTAFCASLGCRPAIAETACHEDASGIGPQRKVDWMNSFFNYTKANNYLAFCYFNAYKPNDTAPEMMLNSSPQSLAAWANILSAHQRGVKG